MNVYFSHRKFVLAPCKTAVALTILVLAAGCATQEKQTSEPPLIQAERRLAKAEKIKLNTEGQAAEYLAVARITAGEISKTRNNSSSDSSQAVTLYNRAVADLAADVPELISQKKNSGVLELRDAGTGETAQLVIESGKPGEYQPATFREIIKAASVDKKGLDENVTRSGVGGTVVGIQQSTTPTPRLEPLKGYRDPLTAVVDFPETNRPSSVRLRLFDPNKVTDVDLEGSRHPLAADFSAPLASYGRINEIWIGFMNMIRGERMRGGAGLLMMRPYDPTRIPVVFVHGLLSSPYVWRNVVNTLAADPVIRQHYQFWVFSYPTGNPIAYSAYLLRDDLDYAKKSMDSSRWCLLAIAWAVYCRGCRRPMLVG